MIAASDAGIAAAIRLAQHGSSIRASLASLDLGFDLDDVREYVPCSLVELIREAPDHKMAHDRLTGAIAGAMIVAVEAERLRR